MILPLPHRAFAGVPAGFEVCASITDAAQRLACYDDEVARLRGDRLAVAPAASPPSIQSEPPVPVRSPEDKFGERDLPTQETPAKKEPELKELTANVALISRRTRGELVMTLDNGQVWAEKVASTYFPLQVGDPVTIKAGVLGSFRMVGPSGRAADVTRVH